MCGDTKSGSRRGDSLLADRQDSFSVISNLLLPASIPYLPTDLLGGTGVTVGRYTFSLKV